MDDDVLDFEALVEGLNAEGLRFLLIGRQAVVLYGAPVTSFDYDLWVDPDQRVEHLKFLEDRVGFELSAAPDDRSRPSVQAFLGADRLDLFTMRTMVNREGEHLSFDVVYRRAVVRADRSDHADAIHIPAIPDLIALKKMAPHPRAKDEEDIAYLRVRLALEQRGELDTISDEDA